jgi:hypothetical protein
MMERGFSILEYICDPSRELGKGLEHLVQVSLGHPRLLGTRILFHLLCITLINRGNDCSDRPLLTIRHQCGNTINLTLSARPHDESAVLSNHHGGEGLAGVNLGAELGLFFFQNLRGNLNTC